MSLFNGMGEEGRRENLKGRRPKEREGEAEEAKGSQQNTEEGGRRKGANTEEGKIPGPPSTASSHGVEHRCPRVRSNVCSIVLLEAFARPTTKAAHPKRFLYFQMVFEALGVFVADA